MNRANELLQVAYNNYAPVKAQVAMIKTLMEMEADNESHAAIAVAIAQAIVDGLQNGNWSIT